jgi:conjugative relaxase-like TrwC/TraI family protein
VGIVGEVDRDALTRALQGQDPRTGRELVAPHVRRVPGFDVAFSGPKSVSVLFGLGDESLRRTIRSEHDAAVAERLATSSRWLP